MLISHTISTYTHSLGDHIYSSNLHKLHPCDNIFQSKLPARVSLINFLFLITFLHSFFFLKIPPLHLAPPFVPSISVNVTPPPPMQIFKPKSRGPCGIPLFFSFTTCSPLLSPVNMNHYQSGPQHPNLQKYSAPPNGYSALTLGPSSVYSQQSSWQNFKKRLDIY